MGRPSKTQTLPARYEPGFLRQVDGRTELYQRLKNDYEEIVEDLGGFDQLSHVQFTLVERFVFLEEQLRQMEYTMLNNPKKAAELSGRHTQAVNALQGLAKTIGFKRREKTRTVRAIVSGARNGHR